MDIVTFVQKITETIYKGCNKKRKYKDILKNVESAVDNETLSPVPYYYIGVLNVLEEMGISDFNDEVMEEQLKKYSRELTLDRLCIIISDMFGRHYDDDEEIVTEFTKGFEDEFKKNFKYMDIISDVTSNIIQNIRNFVKDFTENIEDFDFSSFDRELTENLYDCIDCEENFEEDDSDEEYQPGSDEETESEGSSDEEDEGIHELLDQKIEEIRILKDRIQGLEIQIMSMKDINDKYSQLLNITQESASQARRMFRVGFVVAFVMMFAPLVLQEPKICFDSNLLN